VNTINLIRILPILLLSLSVDAGFLDDIKGKIFGNDMSVFTECVDTLEKKDVAKSKAEQLCINKYADTIDNDDWIEDDSKARKNGGVTLRYFNNSNYVIKKIEYSGFAYCKPLYTIIMAANRDENTSPCDKQWFDGVKYVHVEPNSNKTIALYNQFVIPDDVVEGDWGWILKDGYTLNGPTFNRAFGFHLDY
jgi:hypothetical protein